MSYLPHEPPSHLPIHPTSLHCLRALGLSFLHHNSKFPLAIYFTYGNLYVSTLLSPLIPSSPFPTPVVQNLFSMSASPLLPANRSISTIFKIRVLNWGPIHVVSGRTCTIYSLPYISLKSSLIIHSYTRHKLNNKDWLLVDYWSKARVF